MFSRRTRCCPTIRFSTRFLTRARASGMVAAFDLAVTEPEWALGFRFDIVLRGDRRDADGEVKCITTDPFSDRRAVLRFRPDHPRRRHRSRSLGGPAVTFTVEGTGSRRRGPPLPDALIEIWQANAAGSTSASGGRQDRRGLRRSRGSGGCATDRRRTIRLHHGDARPRAGTRRGARSRRRTCWSACSRAV